MEDEPTTAQADPAPRVGDAQDPPAPSEDGVVGVDADLAELQARAAERDEYLALAQRTRADLDNYRKRVVRDAAAAESRAVGRLVRDLLPGLDNLDRALAAAAAAGQAGQLVDGMRLVRDDLSGALGRAGVESFTSHGERFDPELHEAVAQTPVAGAEPGTVVEVYQDGYRMNGTLIRPARVVVAAAPPPPAPAPTSEAPAPDDRGT